MVSLHKIGIFWGNQLLVLMGNTTGYISIMCAVVSGRYAGEVTAAAIIEGDITEQRLSKSEEMCHVCTLPDGMGKASRGYPG